MLCTRSRGGTESLPSRVYVSRVSSDDPESALAVRTHCVRPQHIDPEPCSTALLDGEAARESKLSAAALDDDIPQPQFLPAKVKGRGDRRSQTSHTRAVSDDIAVVRPPTARMRPDPVNCLVTMNTLPPLAEDPPAPSAEIAPSTLNVSVTTSWIARPPRLLPSASQVQRFDG